MYCGNVVCSRQRKVCVVVVWFVEGKKTVCVVEVGKVFIAIMWLVQCRKSGCTAGMWFVRVGKSSYCGNVLFSTQKKDNKSKAMCVF